MLDYLGKSSHRQGLLPLDRHEDWLHFLGDTLVFVGTYFSIAIITDGGTSKMKKNYINYVYPKWYTYYH